MIQDIPDNDWMLRADIAWAYELIVECDLTFDALGFPRHLDNFLKLLIRYPDMRVVIDHCMKPQIRIHSSDNFAQWACGMTRLAEDTSAFCKFSGLVTEANGWSLAAMRPYTEHKSLGLKGSCGDQTGRFAVLRPVTLHGSRQRAS